MSGQSVQPFLLVFEAEYFLVTVGESRALGMGEAGGKALALATASEVTVSVLTTSFCDTVFIVVTSFC